MQIKLLKTRDSSGVGSVVSFISDWSTLSFIPTVNDNDKGYTQQTYNNDEHNDKKKSGLEKVTESYQKQKSNSEAKRQKKPSIIGESEDNKPAPIDDITDGHISFNANSKKSIIKNVKSKNGSNHPQAFMSGTALKRV